VTLVPTLRLPSRAWFALALACPALLALTVARFGVDVPWFDEWIWAPLIVKLRAGTLTVADLWAQQNAHRSFFPSVVAIALARDHAWSAVREEFAGIAFLAITVALLVALVARSVRPAAAGPLGLIVGLLACSLGQSQNVLWGFQLSWFLTIAAIVATVFLLRTFPGSGLAFGVAALAAAIASYSLIFGFGAWLAGAIALAGRSRAASARVLVWLALGLATAGAFFYGYAAPPAEPYAGDAARSPLLAAGYMLTYLGGALGIWSGVPLALFWGIAGVAAFVRLALLTAGDERARAWIALGSVPLFAAALAIVGRATFGIDQALSSRYVTVSGLFWIALVALLAVALDRGAVAIRTIAARATALLTALAFGGCFVATNVRGWRDLQDTHALQADGRATLLAYRHADDDRIRLLCDDAAFFREQAGALARLGEFPFQR
jgi:hypothetical protein